MRYAIFASHGLRPSWLALGGAGRELALRGALELEATLAGSVRVTAFLARGLGAEADLMLAVEAEELAAAERYLQRLAVTTLGRQLEVRAARLGRAAGQVGIDAGDLCALYAVRGVASAAGVARATRLALEAGVACRAWRTAGLGEEDGLLLANVAEAEVLVSLYEALRGDAALSGVSARPLLLARRMSLALAMERLTSGLDAPPS